MPAVEAEFAAKVFEAWQGKLDFFALFDFAGQLEAGGHYPWVVVLYRTWLKRNQTGYNHFVLFNLGVALAHEQDLAGAMAAYRQAIHLSPSFLQPRINLGLLLESQGDVGTALVEWRWVVDQAKRGDPAERALRQQAQSNLDRHPAPEPQPAPLPAGPRVRGLSVELTFQVDDTRPEAATWCRDLAREAVAALAAAGLPPGIAGCAVAGAPPFGEPGEPVPRVTALIDGQGAGSQLRVCLEDLGAQSLFREGALEIVVVGGASGEEASSLEAFAAGCPHQVQHLPGRPKDTPGQAWNRGILAARGTFLILVGPGDRHPPEALERLARVLEDQPDLALVYGDEDLTTDPAAPFASAPRTGRLEWPEFEPARLFEAGHVGPHPLWRRDLHRVHGWFDPGFRQASAYEFWLRLAAAGERFRHVPEVVALGLQDAQGPLGGNPLVASAESYLARARNWPAAWGPLPPLRGNRPMQLGSGA